jgi:16S rRNA (adenine1518-N6/adenine1519-N6)-dimethyltransferase
MAMNHIPRKRFGQNFLRDQNIIQRIVQSINPQPEQHIIEIGPGQGAMTMPVLRLAKAMTAIELDRDLITPLQNAAVGIGTLNVISADALTVDFAELVELAGQRPCRVIGNLPYNISSPLIFHLMEQLTHIVDMHFMLQKEVVDRMAAGPGSKIYGRLSVMVQARCSVESLFKVPPTAFHPVPKVDSAIVRLQPHTTQLSSEMLRTLETLTRAAFSARRKTLGNGLHGLLSEIEIAACGVDPKRRAETLSQAEFQKLAQARLSLVASS